MMTKEGSTKIVTFMTLRAGVLALGYGHISHIMEMHFSYKIISLFPGIDQTNYVYSNDDQGRVYQNCRFMTSRAGIPVPGHGHMVKMQYFFSSFCPHWCMNRTNSV